MRRHLLLCSWLVGCATTPVVTQPTGVQPNAAVEALAEPARPLLVAPSEVVLQTPHDSPIRELLAEPGWAHFITSSGGVVAVHDVATGAVRAWRRPWPRADVHVQHDASGTLLLLTPMSSYEHVALLWSLQDDRMTVLPRTEAELHPSGERLLRVQGDTGAYTLELVELATGQVLATRSHAGFPRASFTPDGQTVVVAEVGEGGNRTDVTLCDANTLATRAYLGETRLPAVLRRTNALLLSTDAGLELRSTRDGSRMGLIPNGEDDGVMYASPGEAHDGSCLALPVPDTYRVRLYRTANLTFVLELNMQDFGSYAVLPGCAGLLGQSSAGELRSFGPGLPTEGVRFGAADALPTHFEGEFIRPVTLVGPDSAIAANGISVASLTRGAVRPRFSVAPPDALSTPSPWAYGFTSSGAAFAVGRGFVHTFGPQGLSPSVCEGPSEAMVSPSGTTSLGDRAQFCDLERQRSQRVDVHTTTQAGRFVLAHDPTGAMHVIDIEQGASTPVAAGAGSFHTPVAVSESGHVLAYGHTNGNSVRLVDGAPRGARPRTLTLRRRASRYTLYDTMLAVESEQHVTLYALDGSVTVDREVVATRFVPPTPTRSAFLVSDGAHTDVIEARTGATLGTFDGAPVQELYTGAAFEPDPRLPLPVIRHGDTTAFVQVTDGRARLLPLGDARVLGSDPLEHHLAVCRAGELSVLELATQVSRAFGTCIASDRVRVRGDGSALLMVRGVRLTLRTPQGERTLHLVARPGATPVLFTDAGGAYTGSAELVPRVRLRRAGPLLTAPLEPLTPASETPALWDVFGTAP